MTANRRLESKRRLKTFRYAYVSVSRARFDARIYTDHVASLGKNLSHTDQLAANGWLATRRGISSPVATSRTAMRFSAE